MSVWIIGALTQYRNSIENFQDLIDAGGIAQLHSLLCSKTELLIDCGRTILVKMMESSDNFVSLVITPDLIPRLMATHSDSFHCFIRILNPIDQLYPYLSSDDLKIIIPAALKYIGEDGIYAGATLHFIANLLKVDVLHPSIDQIFLDTEFIHSVFEVMKNGLCGNHIALRGFIEVLRCLLVQNSIALSFDLELMNGFAFLVERHSFDSLRPLIACLSHFINAENRSLVLQSDLLPALLKRKHDFEPVSSDFLSLVQPIIENQDTEYLEAFVNFGLLHVLCKLMETLQRLYGSSIPLTNAINLTQSLLKLNSKYVQMIKKIKLTKRLKELILTGISEQELNEPEAILSTDPSASRKRHGSEGSQSKNTKRKKSH